MSDYMPVGDLSVVSICLVMIFLTIFSYVHNTRAFRIFLTIVAVLVMAAIADVAFHVRLANEIPNLHLDTYILRCVYHALLFMVFFLFAVYVGEAGRMSRRERTAFVAAAALIYVTVIVMDVVQAVHRVPASQMLDDISFAQPDGFAVGYVAFSVLLVSQMSFVRDRLYRKVVMGFFSTIAVSFFMLLMQMHHGQTSYTVMTFLYPVIGMFYFMHSNPYDVEIGALDRSALTDQARTFHAQGREFVFISLYLRAFAEGARVPDEVNGLIRRFTETVFREASLVRVAKGHVVLIFPVAKNPGYEEQIRSGLELLKEANARFHYDYKLVIGRSVDEITANSNYIVFIENIQRCMDENSIRWVDDEDVRRFWREEKILKGLEDIRRQGDIDDPRVLVYCQPVLNVATGTYDTAEALMRMRLDELGMVFPDEFIPLAEQAGYIHDLTQIILHKTCSCICEMLAEGYQLHRISVNVSALELSDESFCSDVTRIVKDSGIPEDKIAIELTESQTDSGFRVMQSRIAELKALGIKFYLDDFGTGYSNMERIMELPFDIIKFDRSLVLASDASTRSRQIVVGLADIFDKMNYSVLFEGVEGQEEEDMCIGMRASYLQGYKYSRPIPIEGLRDYFVRS